MFSNLFLDNHQIYIHILPAIKKNVRNSKVRAERILYNQREVFLRVKAGHFQQEQEEKLYHIWVALLASYLAKDHRILRQKMEALLTFNI